MILAHVNDGYCQLRWSYELLRLMFAVANLPYFTICVRLSVRPVVSKRMHHSYFWAALILRNSEDILLSRAWNIRNVRKFWYFRPKSPFILGKLWDKPMVTIEIGSRWIRVGSDDLEWPWKWMTGREDHIFFRRISVITFVPFWPRMNKWGDWNRGSGQRGTVARAKKQGLKTREWTSRHEEAAVDIARVDNLARRSSGGQRGEWTTWHEEAKVDNAGVSDREK